MPVPSGLVVKNGSRAHHIAVIRKHLDLHILPRLGKLKLSKLTRETIERFRDELQKGTIEVDQPYHGRSLARFWCR